MKVIDNIIETPIYPYIFPQEKEEILFFDIETTGLSPKASSLYMVGAMYFDTASGSWHLKQFFADNYKSEAAIINSFLEMLGRFKYLYHFNGKTFDIPYILNKCKKHGICLDRHCSEIFNDTGSIYSIDILALIRPLKKMLYIEKASQTELEKWLGITRDDKYNGGELIPVYSQYMQYRLTEPEKAPGLEKLLLLHNHDDIAQMLNICSILSYRDVFSEENNFTITSITPGDAGYINISARHNIAVPKKTAILKPYPESREETVPVQDAVLTLDRNTAILSVPVFSGVLKHFFPGYKDYYYITDRDTAVHKSLLPNACKGYKKATAATCYEKKEGIFIPSLTLRRQEDDSVQFYITYHDKICFYMLPGGMVSKDHPFWQNYMAGQLTSFI